MLQPSLGPHPPSPAPPCISPPACLALHPASPVRLTGPLIHELPDHEEHLHQGLIFSPSQPDSVEEPEGGWGAGRGGEASWRLLHSLAPVVSPTGFGFLLPWVQRLAPPPMQPVPTRLRLTGAAPCLHMPCRARHGALLASPAPTASTAAGAAAAAAAAADGGPPGKHGHWAAATHALPAPSSARPAAAAAGGQGGARGWRHPRSRRRRRRRARSGGRPRLASAGAPCRGDGAQ